MGTQPTDFYRTLIGRLLGLALITLFIFDMPLYFAWRDDVDYQSRLACGQKIRWEGLMVTLRQLEDSPEQVLLKEKSKLFLFQMTLFGEVEKIPIHFGGGGSAVLLSYNQSLYFITAKHVVESFVETSRGSGLKNSLAILHRYNINVGIPIEEFILDKYYDIAAVKVPEKYLSKLNTDLYLAGTPEVGQNVFSCGFPNSSFFGSSGIIIAERYGAILYTAPIYKGCSGGAIFNEINGDNKLSGISVGLGCEYVDFKSDLPFSIGISSQTIARFLSEIK